MPEISELEPWLASIAANLTPAARRRLSLKIGQALRRANAGRISRNEVPDGGRMEPRKPRKARKSAKTGRIKRTGLMFRKLRLARAMMLRTDGNGPELSFRGRARVAAEHHYGAEVIVGKTKDGRTIKARMAERQLLGFSSADPDMIMDAATRHLTG